MRVVGSREFEQRCCQNSPATTNNTSGRLPAHNHRHHHRHRRFGPAQARTNKWLRLEESGHLKAMTMTQVCSTLLNLDAGVYVQPGIDEALRLPCLQVSNSKFTQQEYDRYARHREAANMGPITKGDIQKVVKQLEDAKKWVAYIYPISQSTSSPQQLHVSAARLRHCKHDWTFEHSPAPQTLPAATSTPWTTSSAGLQRTAAGALCWVPLRKPKHAWSCS